MDERTKKTFNRLVELRQRDPELLEGLRRLASETGDFDEFAAAVEYKLRERAKARAAAEKAALAKPAPAASGTDAKAAPAPAGDDEPAPPKGSLDKLDADERWAALWKRIERSTPLSEMFGPGGADFAGAGAREVATLAAFADVAPDRAESLYSEDAVFMAVLELARGSSLASPSELTEDTLAALASFVTNYNDAARKLDEAAASGLWDELIPMLASGHAPVGEADGGAARFHEEIASLMPAEARQTVFQDKRVRVLTSARLFRVVWRSWPTFVQALDSLSNEQRSSPERWRRQAAAALDLLRKDPSAAPAVEEFEAEIGLRRDVVTHLLEVRRIVKRDALVRAWPDVGLLAMSNIGSIREIEKLIRGHNREALPPQPESFLHEESYAIYDVCRADQRLVRFLRLPPYFTEMDFGKAADALRREAARDAGRTHTQRQPADASQRTTTTTKTTTTTTTSGTGSPADDAKTPAAQDGADKTPAATEAAPPDKRKARDAAAPRLVYEGTIHILRPLYAVADTPLQHEIGFSRGRDEPLLGGATFPADVAMKEILSALRLPPEGETHRYIADIFRRPDGTRRVTQAGKVLYGLLMDVMGAAASAANAPGSKFVEQFVSFLADTVRGDRPPRLYVNTDDEKVAALPWEWLTFPNTEKSFLLRPDASVIRTVSDAPTRPPVEFYPLRVLVLAAGPNEQARALAVKKVEDLSGLWLEKEAVEVKTLTSPQLTVSNFVSILSEFDPQVLYAETHAEWSYAEKGGADPSIILSEKWAVDGSSPQLVEVLRGSALRLFVAGDNPNGTFESNPLLGLVIGMMKRGVAAAVAPTRPVEQSMSRIFLHNFFDAWLGGQTLEASVASAREAVGGARGDWSAYALFSTAAGLAGVCRR